jgi:hypothetical protein
MKRHLNTLFVTLEGCYQHKDGPALSDLKSGISNFKFGKR